jgi:threonine 3-dehydrogenase
VRGSRSGDRVAGEGHLTCGHCRNCRAGRRHLCRNTVGVGVNVPGAFVERFALPASNVFKLPDALPDRIAAILDPFGNAVHTALSFDLVGEDVLITGGGPIGCMAAAVCRFVGARHVVVTDVNPYRLELARAWGPPSRSTRRPRGSTWRRHGRPGHDRGFDVSSRCRARPRRCASCSRR